MMKKISIIPDGIKKELGGEDISEGVQNLRRRIHRVGDISPHTLRRPGAMLLNV